MLDAGDGSQGAQGQAKMVARFRLARREFPVVLELNRLKQRANADFRALLAVHEAGHGLVYALLFGRAPQEIRINVASFEGGYNSYVKRKASVEAEHARQHLREPGRPRGRAAGVRRCRRHHRR